MSDTNTDEGHDWFRGGQINGLPTLVCMNCGLLWLPHQNRPDDAVCAQRQAQILAGLGQ